VRVVSVLEELAREVSEAKARARATVTEAERLCDLSQRMRAARQGEVGLCRCAWCGRLKVGERADWLHLEEIGSGHQHIPASLLRRASHGICPDCFREQVARRPRSSAAS
jgi:hypothetical protein